MRMTKRQRDKLYVKWFLEDDSAQDHREALAALDDLCSTYRANGITTPLIDVGKERRLLHAASVAAFDQFLMTRTIQ